MRQFVVLEKQNGRLEIMRQGVNLLAHRAGEVIALGTVRGRVADRGLIALPLPPEAAPADAR